MVSSLWTQVVRASAAGLRPRAAVLVPTLCRSLRHAGVSSQTPLLSLKRGYAAEATARVEAEESVTAEEGDTFDHKPLFSSLEGKIHPNTLKALTQKPFCYEHMLVVQAEVLPLLPGLAMPRVDNPESKDLLVKARTGTGKTLAFLVPAVEARIKQLEDVAPGDANVQLQYAKDNIGTLIISPTRELASQIVEEALKVTSAHRGWQVPMFVGGLSKSAQVQQFRHGRKDIVVATAGRLRDVLQDPRSGVAAALKNTKMLILDEADTLLDMGFRDDIEDIMRYLPDTSTRQTLLFSATVSESIKQIADAHLSKNHAFINCVSADASPVHDHIPQYTTVVADPKDQLPHVLRLIFQDQIEHGDKSKVILFLSTTKMTQMMGTILYEVSNTSFPMPRTWTYELHSKKTMGGRVSASNNFRQAKRACVLITSDVSARGVDYPGVTRVIQLGLPKNPEQYVHRVGRTGRGNSLVGRGDLVVAAWEQEFVRRSLNHIPLKPLTVRDFKEECENQLSTSPNGKPHPAIVKFQDLDRCATETVSRLNESVVSETMVSMLGFYNSMTNTLQRSGLQILEELQTWATKGMGLAQAPYVSPQFLQKIGISGGGSRGGARGGSFQRSGSSGGGFRNSYSGSHSPAKTFGERREWRDGAGSSPQRSFGGERREWTDRRPAFNSGGAKPWERSTNSDSAPWTKPAFGGREGGRRTRSYQSRQDDDY